MSRAGGLFGCDICRECGRVCGGRGGNVKEMALRLVSVLALTSLLSRCASAPSDSPRVKLAALHPKPTAHEP